MVTSSCQQRAFLAEFGGLTVVHRHARVPTTLDRFVIDGLLATRGTDPDWVGSMSAARGSPP